MQFKMITLSIQEHEHGISLTEDDPINFCQAMESSNSKKWIDAMKDELKFVQNNDVWDLVELTEILRDCSQGILRLSQANYINKVLDRFGMKDSKPGDTLMAKGDKFSLKQCPNNDFERNEMQKIPYASTIRSLMYTQVCICPDIAFVMGVLDRMSRQQTLHIWIHLHASWRSYLLEVVDGIERQLKIYYDNNPSVLYSNNNKCSTKSKFIDIKSLVVKERV
ncbi:hypothetical protein CR513_37463, partial [Mucuna pruriens]